MTCQKPFIIFVQSIQCDVVFLVQFLDSNVVPYRQLHYVELLKNHFFFLMMQQMTFLYFLSDNIISIWLSQTQ